MRVLHFLMAEQAWQSQVPGFKLGKKGLGMLSEIALVRLRGRNAQTKKVDRIALARKYRAWLDDGFKAGRLSNAIQCPNTKAEFIRKHFYTCNPKHQTDKKSAPAHRNILNRGLRNLA